jgi:biopolymer transport protein ExbD
MGSRAGARPAAFDEESDMAIATSSGSQLSEMNVTPLVDVMLVLLIIFMVTVPTIDFANSFPLTKAPPGPVELAPLRVHVGAGDTLMLEGQLVTIDQLRARFAVEAAKGFVAGQVDPKRQPFLQLSVEPEADYGLVVQVMATAKNQNLMRVAIAD